MIRASLPSSDGDHGEGARTGNYELVVEIGQGEDARITNWILVKVRVKIGGSV